MPVRLGLVLTSARADHPFCSAAFCSTHLCRHYFALACFALPRWHRTAARPALGRYHECVGDQFLRRFLSLLCLPDLLLAWPDFAICPGWYGHWRRSWLARFDTDPMGKPSRRIFLHAQPLARSTHHAGNRSPSCLWLVARRAPDEQHWFLSAAGSQLSVAVAAGLIGYYLVYAIGVRIRITRHEKRRHD